MKEEDGVVRARSFRVPFGLLDGTLVPRDEAVRGLRYVCPVCHERLRLRAGSVRRKHLSHAPNGTCSAETVRHVTAKLQLAMTLRSWLAGTVEVTCARECEECRAQLPFKLPRSRADRVAVEERLPSGLMPDVSLWLGDDCTLAIEIFATHAIGGEKALALAPAWVELDADAVLAEATNWNPLRARLRRAPCARCREREERFHSEYGTPGVGYARKGIDCWNCGRAIHWFAWAGHRACGQDEPPAGRPRTLKRRFSPTAGHAYWMNTCPHCGASQGDTFLYGGPGSRTLDRMMGLA